MSGVMWQRVEGGLVFLAAIGGVVALGPSGLAPVWWLALLVFFAPDLGFLGYAGGPRIGAAVYNALHLYAPGIALALAGMAGAVPPEVIAFGLLWFGHVGFDRMLGYGLKEPTGFSDTHLGRIGRR